nr:type II toxin-antitoxin system HicB family antitoxin [Mesorhizobium sp. B1-1-8]
MSKEDSDFGVSFPDLSGVTAGGSLHEARQLAEQGLAFHVEGLIEAGEPVPEPSSTEKLASEPPCNDLYPCAIEGKVQRQQLTGVRIVFLIWKPWSSTAAKPCFTS